MPQTPMPQVHPIPPLFDAEFRRHGIAQALEAALIRLHLERGWLPFCFVAPDNVPSLSLQAKLGLTNIHIPAIWLF